MVVKQASKVTNASKVGIMCPFESHLNHLCDLLPLASSCVVRRPLTVLHFYLVLKTTRPIVYIFAVKHLYYKGHPHGSTLPGAPQAGQHMQKSEINTKYSLPPHRWGQNKMYYYKVHETLYQDCKINNSFKNV